MNSTNNTRVGSKETSGIRYSQSQVHVKLEGPPSTKHASSAGATRREQPPKLDPQQMYVQ